MRRLRREASPNRTFHLRHVAADTVCGNAGVRMAFNLLKDPREGRIIEHFPKELLRD